MNDKELFMRALNLALKLSAAGENIMEVRYYSGINELIVSFGDKTATVKTGWNISDIDLMQIVIEVIRKETEGSKNDNKYTISIPSTQKLIKLASDSRKPLSVNSTTILSGFNP